MTRPDDVRRAPASSSKLIPDEAVLATLRSGDWARIEHLVDVMWYELPARYPEELIALLDRSPAEEIARRPRIVSAGMLAHQFLPRGNDLHLRGLRQAFSASRLRHEAYELREHEHPHDRLAVELACLIATRLDGELEAARDLGDRIHARLRSSAGVAFPWERSFVAMRPGQLSLQRGLTLTLLGGFSGAMQLYKQAVAEAGPPPYQHFAGANAAANIAMLAAGQGHHELAHTWLDRVDGYAAVPPQIEHLTLLGAKVARAQLAVDNLDRKTAMAHLVDVGQGSDEVELWPFVAAVYASFDAAFNEPSVGLERLKSSAFSHDHNLEQSTIAGRWLFRSYLDLLVESGEVNIAVQLADRAGRHVITMAPIARANLIAGRHSEAARLASRAMRRTALSSRDALELRLLLSVALFRLGRKEEAADSFGSALRMHLPIERPGAYARFASDELDALMRLVGQSPEHRPPSWQKETQMVALTKSETRVLRLLAENQSTPQIATLTGLSVNTVRTHAKSIYRKLGASSRGEVLLQAERRGLLHE